MAATSKSATQSSSLTLATQGFPERTVLRPPAWPVKNVAQGLFGRELEQI
jgi:hypothetical protein